MGNPALKKIGKRVLQIGLPLAIVAAFLYKVHDWNWHILTANASQWNLWLLAGPVAVGASAEARSAPTGGAVAAGVQSAAAAVTTGVAGANPPAPGHACASTWPQSLCAISPAISGTF